MPFHVDRLARLSLGQTINLEVHKDIVANGNPDPSVLQTHVDSLFPDGFSEHGNRYFLTSGMSAQIAEPNIELIYEYVRRAEFPERPSRFQSVFAAEDLASAQQFALRFPGGGIANPPIWEVAGQPAFRGDMNYLTLQGSILVVSWFAHCYWEGKPSPAGQSLWEVLLEPPVQVVRRAA